MSENVLVDARLTKLDYVKGITNPYPERFERTQDLFPVWIQQSKEAYKYHVPFIRGRFQW